MGLVLIGWYGTGDAKDERTRRNTSTSGSGIFKKPKGSPDHVL